MTHIKITRDPVEAPITQVELFCGVPLTLKTSGGGLRLNLNRSSFECTPRKWVEWLEAALLLARQEVNNNG